MYGGVEVDPHGRVCLLMLSGDHPLSNRLLGPLCALTGSELDIVLDKSEGITWALHGM